MIHIQNIIIGVKDLEQDQMGKYQNKLYIWYYNYWYPNIGTNNGYMRNGLYVGKPRNV